MNLLLVLSVFTGIGIADVPYMIKNKRWRDLIIYSVIFLLVLTLGVLIVSGVKIPSPIKAIQAFYKDVLRLSFKMP